MYPPSPLAVHIVSKPKKQTMELKQVQGPRVMAKVLLLVSFVTLAVLDNYNVWTIQNSRPLVCRKN